MTDVECGTSVFEMAFVLIDPSIPDPSQPDDSLVRAHVLRMNG